MHHEYGRLTLATAGLLFITEAKSEDPIPIEFRRPYLMLLFQLCLVGYTFHFLLALN